MRTRPAVWSTAALVSLALGAAASSAAAAAERTSIVGREGVLTLTTRAPTGQPGRWRVEFQEQISQTAGASRIAGGSLRGVADVDCAASQFRVVKFSVFASPKFTGALLLDVNERNEWRSPGPGTTMGRVLAVVCAKTKVQARADKLAEPAAPPIAPSAGGGAFYVQLASLPSADAARQAWDGLKGAAPGILDDRLRRLTTATVRGRRVYRVLAGGFGTRAQAETVCKALAALSASCFVRPGDAS